MPRALSGNSFAGNTVVEQLLKCLLKYVTRTWGFCPRREGMRSRKLEVVDCGEMKPGGRHGWRILFQLCLNLDLFVHLFLSVQMESFACASTSGSPIIEEVRFRLNATELEPFRKF